LSQGVIKTRIDSIKNLECYIGTISRTKAKFFTLLLSKNNEIHTNYLKRFAGVEIQILPYKGVRNELTIILLEDELTEIFILFIEDIINSLNSIENKEDALIIISRRVKYWQKLFSKYTNGLLSQQQRGLFGELNFIKQLIECGTNYEYVLKAWQAPMGSNQDFYFNNTAIEVKTSKSNTPSIKIANEYQLDITGFNKLFIVFYELIEFPNDENTLLKLINEIRMTLKDKEELLSDFNQKLDYLGISSNLESEYDKIGYVVRKENYYNVNKEFPKITFDSINEAISKVSYEVAPNKCTKFEIDFKEILKEIN
jgi:hypothetical protein